MVDHCGVTLAPGRLHDDRLSGFDDVLALAQFPNVALKWSHAPRLSGAPTPTRTCWPCCSVSWKPSGPSG
ncbi:hypothetical protein ACFSC4_26570 [Deinococcus malanensis]|uniref:hypothetical protein n=1 Tax=Deinococcus malanensis TaxID=1706855 RepID=UPI00363E9812